MNVLDHTGRCDPRSERQRASKKWTVGGNIQCQGPIDMACRYHVCHVVNLCSPWIITDDITTNHKHTISPSCSY